MTAGTPSTLQPDEGGSHPDSSSEKDLASAATTDEDPIFRGLMILPPRQKEGSSAIGLALPPLRSDEPVQSLRSALGEVIGYAHLTNLRFELEPPAETNRSDANGGRKVGVVNPSIVSPFTGKDAVIALPVHTRDGVENALDDFGDLSSMLDKGLQDGCGFRIVLLRYDASTLKDHVGRLRSLFEGNVPTSSFLVEDREAEESVDTEGDKKPPAQHEEEMEHLPHQERDIEHTDDALKPKPLPELKVYSNTGQITLDGSNLADFFYLAAGEEYDDLHGASKSKKKKKVKNGKNDGPVDGVQLAREKIPRWNEVEEQCRVNCTIQYSGFHPPPPQRKWMGDLAYFNVSFEGVNLPVTATVMGFYVNRSKGPVFDPAPAPEPHFSHSMLDCLLSASEKLRNAWASALEAAKERASLLNLFNRVPFTTLFRTAQRGDFDGFRNAASASFATFQALDAALLTPSWLVPVPRKYSIVEDGWTGNQYHPLNPNRADEDLQNSFGIDIRTGANRDWNEELQLAREMPTETLTERLERARQIYKVMSEFGEAALMGVKAITEGQILPMNPNEAARSQVFLHNNIFFSRGVDAGPETFKIAKGDNAARKAANRDVQCIGTFHRMEKSGLHTLATVVIDFLGSRFICQSVLPGILIGEKSHTLLFGAVETGVPVKWNEEMHKILEEKIGDGMRIATRPVFAKPLTKERLAELEEQKRNLPLLAEAWKRNQPTVDDVNDDAIINTCVPLEAKGILGSDQRKYVLDFSRLTPRDANWIPSEKGGTGRFEKTKTGNGKSIPLIPPSLEDDEWVMCVLRPEMVTRFTQVMMAKQIKARKLREAELKDSSKSSEMQEKDPDNEGKEKDESDSSLTKEDLEYLESLKLNVNVFLPHVRSFKGIADDAAATHQADEQLVREVAEFLWDDALPRITKIVKEGSVHQFPVDGKTLTETLHRHGINCRYMGRLAMLARDEEENDLKVELALKEGKSAMVERKLMPKAWLDMLECEMIARAAKHVLDGYLRENGAVASSQPSQTIASFLSALVSESEETAAQTEMRMEKRSPTLPDEDEVGALTICGVGGGGDAVVHPVRSRDEIWNDIEKEVGRRFRYILCIYNRGNKSKRAQYTALLRRVCQRTGVRLLAKNYDLTSGKCFCGGSNTAAGRLSLSYPISPLDIVDIVPLMKHSAGYSEGFTACTVGATIGLPALQVSLSDARACLERAHIQFGNKQLNKGLELAQEAVHLYQRVTENPGHPGVIESLELMATIFLEGGDPGNAILNASKALALTIQSSSFDSAGVVNAHMSLFQMYYAAREMDHAVKHLRAAMFLLEVMVGPRHVEHYTGYHRLGTIYSHEGYRGKYQELALKFFLETKNRESCDRLVDGVTLGSVAKIQTDMYDYKAALENGKKAHRALSMFLSKEHLLLRESEEQLKKIAQLASEKTNSKENHERERAGSEKGDSIVADLSVEDDKKQKKIPKKKKKKGKK